MSEIDRKDWLKFLTTKSDVRYSNFRFCITLAFTIFAIFIASWSLYSNLSSTYNMNFNEIFFLIIILLFGAAIFLCMSIVNIYKFHKIEDLNRDILCNNIRGIDEKEICNNIFTRYSTIEPRNFLGSVIEMISKLLTKTAIFIIIAILVIIALLFSLTHWSDIQSVTNSLGIISNISLIFNFIVIILMLVTIIAGDKSLRLSTNKNIQALKEEVTRQIDCYQKTSSEQITAIKESTTNEIREMKTIEKERKLISLLTVRKELEMNFSLMTRNIAGKDDFIKGNSLIADFFKVSAFNQGLITNFLTDENLIDKILLVYQDLNIANNFIKMAIDTNIIPLTNKANIISEYNKNIIRICENQKDNCYGIIEELIKIESNFRS